MLIRSESRNRARFFDEVVSGVRRDFETNQHVRDSFGPNGTRPMLSLLNKVYLPNIRHGVVRVDPRRTAANELPVVPLLASDRFRLDDGMAELTPMQLDLAAEQLASWQKRRRTDTAATVRQLLASRREMYARGEGLEAGPIEGNLLGFAKAEGLRVELDKSAFPGMGNSSRRELRGVPLIGLLMPAKGATLQSPPRTTLSHELWHDFQIMRRPFVAAEPERYEDMILRDELEAHHLGAVYEVALYHSGDPEFAVDPPPFNDLLIDNIRTENVISESDPFKPSARVRTALDEKGLDLS